MLRKVDSYQLAIAAVWAAAGVNLVAVIAGIVRHDYGSAGVQSVLIVCLAAWGRLVPRVIATLDAKLGEATAQERMAQIALEALKKQMDAGDLHLTVRGVRGVKLADRMN